jgi:molybdopterin synthase catalytic subunit
VDATERRVRARWTPSDAAVVHRSGLVDASRAVLVAAVFSPSGPSVELRRAYVRALRRATRVTGHELDIVADRAFGACRPRSQRWSLDQS